jgi:hypothetical protein
VLKPIPWSTVLQTIRGKSGAAPSDYEADAIYRDFASRQIFAMKDSLIGRASNASGVVPFTYRMFFYEMTMSANPGEWPFARLGAGWFQVCAVDAAAAVAASDSDAVASMSAVSSKARSQPIYP